MRVAHAFYSEHDLDICPLHDSQGRTTQHKPHQRWRHIDDHEPKHHNRSSRRVCVHQGPDKRHKTCWLAGRQRRSDGRWMRRRRLRRDGRWRRLKQRGGEALQHAHLCAAAVAALVSVASVRAQEQLELCRWRVCPQRRQAHQGMPHRARARPPRSQRRCCTHGGSIPSCSGNTGRCADKHCGHAPRGNQQSCSAAGLMTSLTQTNQFSSSLPPLERERDWEPEPQQEGEREREPQRERQEREGELPREGEPQREGERERELEPQREREREGKREPVQEVQGLPQHAQCPADRLPQTEQPLLQPAQHVLASRPLLLPSRSSSGDADELLLLTTRWATNAKSQRLPRERKRLRLATSRVRGRVRRRVRR